MPTLRPITRDELPAVGTRSGGVSNGMITEFLASGAELTQVDVDPDGDDKSIASIRSTLGNFVKRHNVPVKVFTRGGNLYLERVSDEEAAAAANGDGQ